MPSKGRKRRAPRTRRPFPLSAVLWTLVVVNVTVGLFVSPLTSLRKVRVLGAAASDQTRIESEIQRWRDVPVLRLGQDWAQYRLENNSEVKSSTLDKNVLGRAVVRIQLRQPVARFVNTRLYLDESGFPFRSERAFGGLPSLMPPPGTFDTSLTLAGGWESGPVARMCQELSVQVPNVDWKVEVDDRGVISLMSNSGAEVVMGSSDSLPQKVEKLKALLLAKPDLLEKVRRLVLTAPEAPMVVRG